MYSPMSFIGIWSSSLRLCKVTMVYLQCPVAVPTSIRCLGIVVTNEYSISLILSAFSLLQVQEVCCTYIV